MHVWLCNWHSFHRHAVPICCVRNLALSDPPATCRHFTAVCCFYPVTMYQWMPWNSQIVVKMGTESLVWVKVSSATDKQAGQVLPSDRMIRIQATSAFIFLLKATDSHFPGVTWKKCTRKQTLDLRVKSIICLFIMSFAVIGFGTTSLSCSVCLSEQVPDDASALT